MSAPGNFMVKAELATAGSTVAARSGQIYELLQSLKARTQGLAEFWTGVGASESYQQLQTEWDVASRNLFGDGTKSADSILGSISFDLDRIAENWGATEGANTKTWAH